MISPPSTKLLTNSARSANGIVNPRQDQQEPQSAQSPPPYQIPRPPVSGGLSPQIEPRSPTQMSMSPRNRSNDYNTRRPSFSPAAESPPAYPSHLLNPINGIYHVSGHHSLDRRMKTANPPKPPSPKEHFDNPREVPRALKWRNAAQQEYDDRY